MYIVYGAGKIGNAFLNRCKEKGIKAIILVDSNPQLWGEEVNGFKIMNPSEIDYNKVDLVIISVGDNYYEEIKKLLITKISEDKIAYYSDVLMLSLYDNLNLGSVRLNQNFVYPGIYKKEQLVQYFDKQSFNDLDNFFYQKKHRLIYKYVHYSEAYDRFFSRYRGKPITLLEIGVYYGGSLQMWKDYFGDNAQIIGLDINPECKKLEEKNIKIYIGDQANRNFLRLLKEQIGKVDIIIDDGGHMMEQQIASFEELFDILSDDGVYLCEDCHTSYWAFYNGGYKKEGTFIEYVKGIIDGLHVQYMEGDVKEDSIISQYSNRIKSLTCYDSMVFIEKREKMVKSISLQINSLENNEIGNT